MIKKVLKEIGEIDDKTIKILNYSFLVSFAIGIAGMLMLLSYGTYSSNYDIYEGGMLLIKDASMFAAQCFACGFIFDKIKKAQNKWKHKKDSAFRKIQKKVKKQNQL